MDVVDPFGQTSIPPSNLRARHKSNSAEIADLLRAPQSGGQIAMKSFHMVMSINGGYPKMINRKIMIFLDLLG